MQSYLDVLWNAKGNINQLGSVFNSVKSSAVIDSPQRRVYDERSVDIQAIFDFILDLSSKFGFKETQEKLFNDFGIFGFVNSFSEFFPNNNPDTIINYFESFYKEDSMTALKCFKGLLSFSDERNSIKSNTVALEQINNFFIDMVKKLKDLGCEDLNFLNDSSPYLIKLFASEELLPKLENPFPVFNERFQKEYASISIEDIIKQKFVNNEASSILNFAKSLNDEIVDDFFKSDKPITNDFKLSVFLASISQNERITNHLYKVLNDSPEKLKEIVDITISNFTTSNLSQQRLMPLLNSSKLSAIILPEAVKNVKFLENIKNTTSSRFEPMIFKDFEKLLESEIKTFTKVMSEERLYLNRAKELDVGFSNSFKDECTNLLREEFRDRIPDFLNEVLDSSLIKFLIEKKVSDSTSGRSEITLAEFKNAIEKQNLRGIDYDSPDYNCLSILNSGQEIFKSIMVLYNVSKDNLSEDIHKKIDILRDENLKNIVAMSSPSEKDVESFVMALSSKNIKILHSDSLSKGELNKFWLSQSFKETFETLNEVSYKMSGGKKVKDSLAEPKSNSNSSVYSSILSLFPKVDFQESDFTFNSGTPIKLGFNLDERFKLRENLISLMISNKDFKNLITDAGIKIEKSNLVKSTVIGHSENLVNLLKSDPDTFVPLVKGKDMMKIISTIPEEINIKIMYEILNGALNDMPKTKEVNQELDTRSFKL